jgi:hypothetical protein
MIKDRISELLLERYCLDEVTRRERNLVETAMKTDPSIQERLNRVGESDRELRRIIHALPAAAEHGTQVQIRRGRPFLWGLAAAVLLCVLLPSAYAILSRTDAAGPDRIKGTAFTADRAALSLYLKRTGAADEALSLEDGAVLQEGDMVQLAYTAPAGDEYYGVIFSIDGRSAVTMHYPYRREQPPVLISGKQTFLNEAYILDDAPDFEIFFMVVSGNPLNVEEILKTAEKLALNPGNAPAESKAAFEGCDVEIIIIRKK